MEMEILIRRHVVIHIACSKVTLHIFRRCITAHHLKTTWHMKLWWCRFRLRTAVLLLIVAWHPYQLSRKSVSWFASREREHNSLCYLISLRLAYKNWTMLKALIPWFNIIVLTWRSLLRCGAVKSATNLPMCYLIVFFLIVSIPLCQ
jgi:hypothetical protein